MTAKVGPMAVISSPPTTTTSVGTGAAGRLRVCDPAAIAVGPMVNVSSLTTAMVEVGEKV